MNSILKRKKNIPFSVILRLATILGTVMLAVTVVWAKKKIILEYLYRLLQSGTASFEYEDNL